ncbi:MAG: hypothetical protein Unbinned4409contig1001_76 [Prokaryotic dsDNA virus sp.]|nr:MAG: hypothetical protein Unbinned4409contig1001_76 [Prokaryotic dsDNA virus sp.]|tara:strand:+ start:164 stop:670 length:507 start_codon:yes stop_codon:yes gene_type:complete
MAHKNTPASPEAITALLKDAKSAVNRAKYTPTASRKEEAIASLGAVVKAIAALTEVPEPAPRKPKAAGTKGGNTKTGKKLQRKARPARSKAQQELDRADAASYKRDDEHMEKLVNDAVVAALKRLSATEPASKPAKRKATVLSHAEIEALKMEALESTDMHISYDDCL